jgi:hypothetical protein
VGGALPFTSNSKSHPISNTKLLEGAFGMY